MIRTLYPVDLLPLLFASGRMPPNQAVASDSLSNSSPVSPEALVEQWFPVRLRRYTWVSLQGGRALGLVSVRSCPASSAWHVDCLRAEPGACLALLDAVSGAAARHGVRRVFLRLPSRSPLATEARRSGFAAYKTDYLYRYQGSEVRPTQTISSSYTISNVSKSDRYRLFQLYSTAVPALVRAAEGMTLTEWQETREPASLLRQHREFVVRSDDQAVGWLRVDSASRTGCFSLILGELSAEVIGWLVGYGLGCLDGKSAVFCIACSFQPALVELLEQLGFELTAECDTLLKEIAVKVTQPHFMPMRA